MTVAELIAALRQHDPKLRVIIPGYEGGYNDVDSTQELQIALDIHDEWYYGPHEDVGSFFLKEVAEYTLENAILIA